MSNSKDIYRQLCEQQGSNIPLFQQYWWLEEVCCATGGKPKCWDVALAMDGDAVMGALPYIVGKKLGISYSLQPQLTPFLGPWYNYAASRHHLDNQHRVLFENEVGDILISQLRRRRLALFMQLFGPDVTNWLPFRWRGYRQTTAYTYRLPDITDTERLFRGFDRDTRQRKIRQLMPRYSFDSQVPPDQLADLHQQWCAARGQKDMSPRPLMMALMTAALKRGQGLVAGLRDDNATLVAALFAPYDDNAAYYLLCAHSPEVNANGLSELLIWHALQYLSARTRSFDFDGGGASPGLERFYRSFGSVQTPYHKVWKLF